MMIMMTTIMMMMVMIMMMMIKNQNRLNSAKYQARTSIVSWL